MAITKFKGVKFTFSTGDYIIPALSLRQVQQLAPRLAVWKGGMDEGSIELVIDTAHAALSRNYPKLTADDVAEMIDLRSMGAVMEAVMGASGMVDAAGGAQGEAPAAA